jgi:hypothetical protein
MADANEGTPRVLTVFEQAGEEAAHAVEIILDRNRGIVPAGIRAALIRSERDRAIRERHRARAEYRDNSDSSLAPGVRATFTPSGYEDAKNEAHGTKPEPFAIEEFTVATNGLTVVTLPEGAYMTGGDWCWFHERASLNSIGRIEIDTPLPVFAVEYAGVVMIEGLQAEERWLNDDFNPDGTLRR